MSLPRLLAGGAVAAVLTGTAACGIAAVEPKIELRDAMSDFAAGRSGTVSLSIASTADDVLAFAAAADPGGDPGTAEDLAQLLSSSVELAYDFGADRDSETDDASRVLVRIGALDAAELRAVDGLWYARADVAGLTREFPDLQEGVDSYRAWLAGGDGTVPPEMVEAGTAVLDGEWVSVDVQEYLESMEAMAEEMAPPGADPAPSPTLSDVTSGEFRDLLGGALRDAITTVERREVHDSLGDHLVVGLDLRKAYETFRAGLPGLFPDVSEETLEQQLPPVSEVPDKRIDVSFWVRDGELTRVELDVAQFLDDPAGSLVLRADVLDPQEITAPSGAVPFDVAALLQAGMTQYEASDEEELVAPEIDAHMIATWVDMDLASVAYDKHTVPTTRFLPEILPFYAGIAEGLEIIAVGERIQVTLGQDTVCLVPSIHGNSEDIEPGPC